MQNKFRSESEPIGIVGAGLVGSLLSLFLARRGIKSEIYERRPDMRRSQRGAGKSINLAISVRGLHALAQVGLETEVLNQAIPMKGRMIHSKTGDLTFQPYSSRQTDCIYSISRADLNCLLMERAEQTGKVKIHFDQKVTEIEIESGTLDLKDGETLQHSTRRHATLIATDGSSSVIRNQIMAHQGEICVQDYLNYGYKELTIPPTEAGSFRMEKNALHIWPRGSYMLIALPNRDGSFTCTLFLPHRGQVSFQALTTANQVADFFQNQFPDVLLLTPTLLDDFLSRPTGRMVTVKCFPWNVSDKLLLLGDAAHAIVPFFGQGMNCGFEDCAVLDQLMETNSDWNSIFDQFVGLRKMHTDRIADMAIENFVEMRDHVGNPRFLLEKSVEQILQKNFPSEFISRYSLVSFSRVPYSSAYQMGEIGKGILSELCSSLKKAEDVDLEKAKFLIHDKLRPLIEQQKEYLHGP